MVWLSPAQGNRPYAPRTGQTVYIVVTPYPENGIFCSLCFRQLLCNHIVPHSLRKTRGVGTPHIIRLLFSRVYALLKIPPVLNVAGSFDPVRGFFPLHPRKPAFRCRSLVVASLRRYFVPSLFLPLGRTSANPLSERGRRGRGKSD